MEGPDGQKFLKVSVKNLGIKGAANAEVKTVLAKYFKVLKAQIAHVSGKTHKFKTFVIDGPVDLTEYNLWLEMHQDTNNEERMINKDKLPNNCHTLKVYCS